MRGGLATQGARRGVIQLRFSQYAFRFSWIEFFGPLVKRWTFRQEEDVKVSKSSLIGLVEFLDGDVSTSQLSYVLYELMKNANCTAADIEKVIVEIKTRIDNDRIAARS
jgi:hypothetical protein